MINEKALDQNYTLVDVHSTTNLSNSDRTSLIENYS
jgi:hypothetical protein